MCFKEVNIKFALGSRMSILKRLYVGTSLTIVAFATFQFLQIFPAFSVLTLQNQYILQFKVKPGLFLLIGILQCVILVSIRSNYLHLRKLEREDTELWSTLSRTKMKSEEEASVLFSMLKNWKQRKNIRRNKGSVSKKHTKYVTNLFIIYYSVKSGKRWHDISPNALGRGANGKNAKIFSWPFTYTYEEKLSWDENISKFKSRYYLCLAITILSPIYHVVINLAYLLGLSAKAMEFLWQYPYLFSIIFLLEIILTGNMLRQTLGDSIL